jgi:DNA-binding FrmR family transcriptional regulator
MMQPQTTFANGINPFGCYVPTVRSTKPNYGRRPNGEKTMAEIVTEWMMQGNDHSTIAEIERGTGMVKKSAKTTVAKMYRFGEVSRTIHAVEKSAKGVNSRVYKYHLTHKSTRYEKWGRQITKLSPPQVKEVKEMRAEGMLLGKIAYIYSVNECTIRDALRGHGAYGAMQ